jgi:hypothetical protein
MRQWSRFFMDITFLGRTPIDAHLSACLDDGESFMEKYPDSQAAEADIFSKD